MAAIFIVLSAAILAGLFYERKLAKGFMVAGLLFILLTLCYHIAYHATPLKINF